MSSETPLNAGNNNNIVDLIATLHSSSAETVSTTALASSASADRNNDINIDSSDFVPARRLLLQCQPTNNDKQCIPITLATHLVIVVFLSVY